MDSNAHHSKGTTPTKGKIVGVSLIVLGSIMLVCFYGFYSYKTNWAEASGQAYADIHKMFLDHPHGAVLHKAVETRLADGKISIQEARELYSLYLSEHGSFAATPHIQGQTANESYPRERYKSLLVSLVGDHGNDNT